jgi:2-polyprenyl-3-methyl-5-hydroxy-6-metoxy-1,4-benzoquinol methylase
MAGMHGGTAVEELSDCTIDQVRDSWSHVARRWSDFVRSGCDVHRDRLHGPALLAACGDVSGLRTLDLGCGEGWCGRHLASGGATVTGVDLSEAMIEEALAHPLQARQRIEYLVMDAARLDRHPWTRPFDLVVACMSLHSMPDPAAALVAARRVLADDGRLVCSIPHPWTHMAGGRQVRRQDDALYLRAEDYFRSAPYRVWWDMTGDEWCTIRWSRPQSEYAAMLRRAGFVVYDQLEPCASWTDIEDHQRLRNAGQIPYYLVLVAGPAQSVTGRRTAAPD